MTTPVSIRISCEFADETGFVSLELYGVDAEQLVRVARNLLEQAAPVAIMQQRESGGSRPAEAAPPSTGAEPEKGPEPPLTRKGGGS